MAIRRRFRRAVHCEGRVRLVSEFRVYLRAVLDAIPVEHHQPVLRAMEPWQGMRLRVDIAKPKARRRIEAAAAALAVGGEPADAAEIVAARFNVSIRQGRRDVAEAMAERGHKLAQTCPRSEAPSPATQPPA